MTAIEKSDYFHKSHATHKRVAMKYRTGRAFVGSVAFVEAIYFSNPHEDVSRKRRPVRPSTTT
jgi:hypothetical protein